MVMGMCMNLLIKIRVAWKLIKFTAGGLEILKTGNIMNIMKVTMAFFRANGTTCIATGAQRITTTAESEDPSLR